MQDDAADLPSRHAGEGAVRHCRSATAATAASGSRMRSQFATALAQQEGVLDQFQKAMQKDDEAFIKLPNRNPGAAALPNRVLGRLAHPVPARRLWLGREYREGARARAGAAAEDRSSPKAATTSGRKMRLRAPDRARRPHPPPTERVSSRSRISGNVAVVGGVAELGDAAVELEPDLAGRSRGAAWRR